MPELRWSLRDDEESAGIRLIEADFSKGRPHLVPPPTVLGHRGSLSFATPVGSRDRSFVVLEGARLVAANGIIELRDGSLVAEPAWGPDNVERWFAQHRPARRVRRVEGRWFSCLLEFAYNYYHWICDVLPRFHGVWSRLPPGVRLVVPARMSAWQWDALAAIGVSRAQCAQLPPDETWAPDELYYAAPAATCGDHDPDAVAWVRDRVLSAVGVSSTPVPERIYISRRLTRRRMVNEEQVWPAFAAAGFATVEAERLTFAEQVRLFTSARAIAGPHGAGFANTLWAPSGARVLEFFSPAYATQRCIWTLAAACRHRYAAAMADDAAPGRSRDLRVDRALADEAIAWLSARD